MSSSSLQKAQLFFILHHMLSRSAKIHHSVPRETHDLANKQDSLVLCKTTSFFLPVAFKTTWRKRHYKCQKWDNCFRLSVAQVMHSISSSISVIYLFSNFLQVFKHQKVKKKAKPNSKKKYRGNQREQEKPDVPSVRLSKRFYGDDASAHQRKEGRINTS